VGRALKFQILAQTTAAVGRCWCVCVCGGGAAVGKFSILFARKSPAWFGRVMNTNWGARARPKRLPACTGHENLKSRLSN